MKKVILSLLGVLTLGLAFTAPTQTFAKENSKFNLPEDAVILYQDEDAVMYQSKSESESKEKLARAPMDYESMWVNKTQPGSFSIYNNRSGNMGVTWKVESSSNSSHARIWMEAPGHLPFLQTKDIYPSDGDVYFRTNGIRGTYTIHFDAFTNVGMRIMCWMYD